MDGVDVAVLDTDGENAIRFGQAGSYPYSRRLRDALGALIADPQRAEHDALAEIAAAVTAEHGDAVARFLDDHGMTHESVDVIGFHGQTVIHRPERGLTRQLCDGDAFAARFDVSTVTGFRLAD